MENKKNRYYEWCWVGHIIVRETDIRGAMKE